MKNSFVVDMLREAVTKRGDVLIALPPTAAGFKVKRNLGKAGTVET